MINKQSSAKEILEFLQSWLYQEPSTEWGDFEWELYDLTEEHLKEYDSE